MDCKGLMINDWVVVPLKDGEVACKVVSVLDTTIKIDNGYGVIETIYGFYVKPLPINEEILKANSFKNEYENENLIEYVYGEKNQVPYVKVVYGKFPDDFHFDVKGMYVEMRGNRFHYVHELQHALRMCNLISFADNLKIG